MRVVDSQVKLTCPSCSEVWRMDPAQARSFAAAMVETAAACEDEMAAALRAELDEAA